MKTRPLVRLIGALALGGMLLLANGSAWFAPAAQASQCAIVAPSKHIPVLRLPQPTNHPEFAVQEKAGQLEVRNPSGAPIYVLPITTTAGFKKQMISAKTTFTIQITNAFLYLENAPHAGSDCIADGGVPAGQSVPQDIHTLLVVQLADQTIAVPVEITFVENLKYASQLRDYQEHQKKGQNYLKGMILMFVILPLAGVVLLFICVAAITVVVQWKR